MFEYGIDVVRNGTLSLGQTQELLSYSEEIANDRARFLPDPVKESLFFGIEDLSRCLRTAKAPIPLKAVYGFIDDEIDQANKPANDEFDRAMRIARDCLHLAFTRVQQHRIGNAALN